MAGILPARRLPSTLVPSPALCRPLFIPGFCLSQRFLLWGLGRSPGFACWHGVNFKPFGPLALASQAPAAIILAALRRFRGATYFRGSRASSSPGAPFWPSGLTLQSSGLAYGQPLTLAVRNLWTIQPPASFFLGYRCFYGMGYQLSHLRILYSRMPLKIATLPLAFRLLFGRFFVSQLTYLGCWHTGLCIIHHFPRGTVSELV